MTDAAQTPVPIIEAAEAVAATIANPTIPIIAEDLLLAHDLANFVKTQLVGKHPGVYDVFRLLFGLQ